MSKQEVKDEYKQTEGNPAVKARIRRIQREAARRRMMAAVPKADVVITNPTHLAGRPLRPGKDARAHRQAKGRASSRRSGDRRDPRRARRREQTRGTTIV